MFENIGEIVLLFWRTLLALPETWRQRQKVFDQFFEIGNASLLMVCVLSFFIGAVIALQTGPIIDVYKRQAANGNEFVSGRFFRAESDDDGLQGAALRVGNKSGGDERHAAGGAAIHPSVHANDQPRLVF